MCANKTDRQQLREILAGYAHGRDGHDSKVWVYRMATDFIARSSRRCAVSSGSTRTRRDLFVTPDSGFAAGCFSDG